MRAHNVIIVTSGLASSLGPRALKQKIEFVLKMGKAPIIVLGPDGDEFLSAIENLDDCEIVFDPNFDPQSSNQFSGVKAGLHATNGPAFVLPLDQPTPRESDWNELERGLLLPSEASSELLLLSCDEKIPSSVDPSLDNQFFLVTRRGLKALRDLPATSSLTASNHSGHFKVGLVSSIFDGQSDSASPEPSTPNFACTPSAAFGLAND